MNRLIDKTTRHTVLLRMDARDERTASHLAGERFGQEHLINVGGGYAEKITYRIIKDADERVLKITQFIKHGDENRVVEAKARMAEMDRDQEY